MIQLELFRRFSSAIYGITRYNIVSIECNTVILHLYTMQPHCSCANITLCKNVTPNPPRPALELVLRQLQPALRLQTLHLPPRIPLPPQLLRLLQFVELASQQAKRRW